ncbi:hypothetical protein ANAPRD1_01325 [Anaplasma phagocytophilum]|nr:hypothetical protein ANAPRD1_01325 [Anaplasma phagocytophilum]
MFLVKDFGLLVSGPHFYTRTQLSYVTPRWWRVERTSGLGRWAEVAVRDMRSCVLLKETRQKTCLLVKMLRWGLYQESLERFEDQFSSVSAPSVRPRTWIVAVKRANQTLSNYDCLCGQHFVVARCICFVPT